MPPQRRSQVTGASTSSAAASSSRTATARPSKLAKEHNLTAREERDIREAFGLFAEPMEGEEEGVIPIEDVRRALIALGIPPTSRHQLAEIVAALDPERDGFATFPSFFAVCALQIHARRAAGLDDDEEAHRAELDEAYALFAGSADAPAITLAHLKKVAALLRLDEEHYQGEKKGGGRDKKDGAAAGPVTEELLKEMIIEANCGAGVAHGVKKDEFDRVMRRAGVWR
ncbi:hypothetical protein VTK56DRAFT_700 [Thermocarpiscus australiensis]